MNTSLETIYDRFLTKIDDADLAQLSVEDIKFHLRQYLDDAIFTHLQPTPLCLTEYDDEGFSSEIPMELQNILAHAMVLAWIEPKIKHDRIMRSAVSGRDYSELSNANQLKALLDLEDRTRAKVDEFITTYFYSHESFKGFS